MAIVCAGVPGGYKNLRQEQWQFVYVFFYFFLKQIYIYIQGQKCNIMLFTSLQYLRLGSLHLMLHFPFSFKRQYAIFDFQHIVFVAILNIFSRFIHPAKKSSLRFEFTVKLKFGTWCITIGKKDWFMVITICWVYTKIRLFVGW